jgi:hypothetical protein
MIMITIRKNSNKHGAEFVADSTTGIARRWL